MQLTAAHEPPGDLGGLQRRALGRRMGSEIAGYRYQDVAPFVAFAPSPMLLHAGLEHLVAVKVGVLAQDRMRQCGDQKVGWMAERQVAGDEAPRIAHRSLAIERLQKRVAQRLAVIWQIVEPVIGLARQSRGRHIEEADQIEAHRPVDHPAQQLGALQLRRMFSGEALQER